MFDEYKKFAKLIKVVEKAHTQGLCEDDASDITEWYCNLDEPPCDPFACSMAVSWLLEGYNVGGILPEDTELSAAYYSLNFRWGKYTSVDDARNIDEFQTAVELYDAFVEEHYK